MATYVNDLRLKEISTGDEAGTWGTSTNTNLELIAEAFSFGTEAITTNADTHTTTIADGSTDPGRSLFLKYTGTLDSTCTITIGPNTVSKLWFIENATSGSQSIIIKQGSGATITIANGQTKAIYSDGAGSGAAMVDAFQDLSVPDLFVDDDLTIGDDLVLSSDSAVITFGADGDTTLTHTDGSGLTLNSTNKIMFNDASQFIQGSSATVLSLGATDEIDLTATAIDVNGTMDVSGALTGTTATFTTADNLAALTVISTDADASVGPLINFQRDSGSPADSDVLGRLQFLGKNDASEDVTYAAIDTIIEDASDGTEDAQFRFRSITAGTVRSRMEFTGAETVFNEASVDLDFRVESDSNTHMLFVDAGNNRVGVGTSSPSAPLDIVSSATGGTTLELDNTSTGGRNYTLYSSGSGNSFGAGNFALYDADAAAVRLLVDSSGNVGIGVTPEAWTVFNPVLQIEGGAIAGSSATNFRVFSNTYYDGSYKRIATGAVTQYEQADGVHIWYSNASGSADSTFTPDEHMRIDSSGNLLVGTTNTDPAGTSNNVVGTAIGSSGYLSMTRDGNTVAFFNRKSDDGTVVQFRKDGSVVGSIGTAGGRLFIADDAQAGFAFASGANRVVSCNSTGTLTDATMDIGEPNYRFKDLYLSGVAYATYVGSSGDTDTSIAFDTADTIRFSTGGTERMRINSAGDWMVSNTVANVASNYSAQEGCGWVDSDHHFEIATTSNRSALEIGKNNANDGAIITFRKQSSPVGSIGTGSGLLTIGKGTGNLVFEDALVAPCSDASAGSSNGVVDLGSSARRFANLYLSGKVEADGVTTTAVAWQSTSNSTSSSKHMRFKNPNGNVGDIRTNGSATAYITSSDYRLKENVVAMSGATERLKQLKPSRFNFIADADTTVDGFLAHEVEDIVPEAIAGEKDAMMDEEYEVTPAVYDDDGNVVTEAVMGIRSVPDYQGIDQSKLVPLLVATIQELEARITQLENN
jgi:hypothetical protein